MRMIAARMLCIASAIIAGSATAAVPEADLIASAVASEAKTANPAAISRQLEASRSRLNERVRFAPGDQIGGVIVFSAGLSSKGVADFAIRHGLEVTRAEAKVATGSLDVVQTMSFGADMLFFLDGPLEQRLEMLVGRQRGVFMAAANAAAANAREFDEDAVVRYRDAAYSRHILFYKIEAVGSARSFDAIAREGGAAAVFVDETNARVEQLAEHRLNGARLRGSGPAIRRAYADGPPPEANGAPIKSAFGAPAFAPPDPPALQPKQRN